MNDGITHFHGCGNLSGPEHLGCPRTVYPAMLALQADHRATQVEAILTDLIAELWAGHPKYGDEPPLWIRLAIDRASAQLRNVSMSLTKGHDNE